MQDSRPNPTVVSFTNLQGSQRIATANLVSAAQNPTGVPQKGIIGVTMSTASGTQKFTAAQIQFYRQQQAMRQQQQLKAALHAASGQKVTVAGTAPQRPPLMKQGIAAGTVTQATGGKQTMARATITEADMAYIKRQALLPQQGKTVAQAQGIAQGLQAQAAHIFAQAGLVQQAGTSASGTPVATLVKAGGMVGVRATTPQQIRQLSLQTQIIGSRKLPGQKVAQIAGKGGVPTQLIVQTQQKPNHPQMTHLQLQQVMKNMQPSTMQQFTHVSTSQGASQVGQVVLAKSQMQRMIPVTVAPGTFKQVIQAASSSPQIRQATPPHAKPIVTTARGSPVPSQVRLQTIAHPIHQQTNQPQQQLNQQPDPTPK